MPKYDQQCCDQGACVWHGEIIAAPFENPSCPRCGGETQRWYPIGSQQHGISSDEIIGGRWVENIAAEPIWIESRSHLRRELKARGLEEKVRHVGVDHSDKSPHTTRWF
jgi:hypothetical protein